MSNNPIILGYNQNSLFTLDGRINNNNKIVSIKNYRTLPKFSCISSTEKGNVVLGSNNGEIRLYKDIGQNAKTLLQCYGDPIRSIDTTKDGNYILCTCDKYLLIICSYFNGINGYEMSLNNNNNINIAIKTLKLKPIDILNYGLEKDCFTPAKFDLNLKEKEMYISSSIGCCIVMWSFKDVLKGNIYDYKINPVNEYIIGNEVKYNKNQIVIAMKNKLRLQNQKIDN